VGPGFLLWTENPAERRQGLCRSDRTVSGEPGTSITYAGRKLADQICEAKGIDFDKMVYIECAPDTNSKLSFYDEEYFEVDFNADLQHKYHQLPNERVKEIIG